MESIYHIETDIECRILHYGKEVCVATPGKDVSIQLRKGRHKLSFISTENEADQYSIMYEVPENDIEDFIEIELIPFKNKREAEEVEARRIAYEAKQNRLLEEKQRQEEKRRKQEEEEKKREKERQEEERRRRIMPVAIALRDGKEYDDQYWGTWEADYTLFPKLFENGRIGFVDFDGNTRIQPLYEWKKYGYKDIYGFSEGLSCVVQERIPIAIEEKPLISSQISTSLNPFVYRPPKRSYCLRYIDKIAYVDSDGKPVLSFGMIKKYGINSFFSQDRIIVTQTEQLGTRNYWIHKGYEEWDDLLNNPLYGAILDRRPYNEQEEELLVELPVFNYKYILIDKRGNMYHEFEQKEGFNTPLVSPFSQGLSIIVWQKPGRRTDPPSTLIEVIDREGNIVLKYMDLPRIESWYWNNSFVFLGRNAYLPININEHKYLELSLDGEFRLQSLIEGTPSLELSYAFNNLFYNNRTRL